MKWVIILKKVSKCIYCSKKYVDKKALYNHIEKMHGDYVPSNISISQHYFNVKNKKTCGRCVICGNVSKWNESVERYERFCSEECKNRYRDDFKKKMMQKYGKEHLLNDVDQQKKMLANRSISGKYLWSDNKSTTLYTGSYEHDFLKFLDYFVNLSPNDVVAPAPQVFDYIDEDGTKRFYIPDFYIASINTLVEIKDGGSNPNKHYNRQEIDARKERLKDEVMRNQKDYNYVKVVDKDYSIFMNFLIDLKNENIEMKEFKKPIISISESFNIVNNKLFSEEYFIDKNEIISRKNEIDLPKNNNSVVENPTVVSLFSIDRILDNANRIYLSSDWHLWKEKDGQIVKNDKFNQIIRNCNIKLGANDVLIFLGDLVDDEFNEKEELRRLLLQIPGTRILVKGNNDIFPNEFYYQCGFKIVTDGFTWKEYTFTHYPVNNTTKINFHGHLHGQEYYKNNYRNHVDVYSKDFKLLELQDAVKRYNNGEFKPEFNNFCPNLSESNLLLENESLKLLENYISNVSKSPYYSENQIYKFNNYGDVSLDLSENSDFMTKIKNSQQQISLYKDVENISGIKNETCKLWYTYSLIENYICNENVDPLYKEKISKSDILQIKGIIVSEMTSALNYINTKDNNFDFNQYYNNTNTNSNLLEETSSMKEIKNLIINLTK